MAPGIMAPKGPPPMKPRRPQPSIMEMAGKARAGSR